MHRYPIGACKQVIDEGARHLLLATSSGIYRLDKEQFTKPERVYYGRVTSVAKRNDIIYAGTLSGLIAIGPDKRKRPYSPLAPLLSRHVTALCQDGDSILWIAGNDATLTAISANRIIAIINKENGLACKKIAVVKVWNNKLWIGTDNGLFVLGNAPPYRILRHLSNLNGLNDNQVNCIDFALGRMWVGTARGLILHGFRSIMP